MLNKKFIFGTLSVSVCVGLLVYYFTSSTKQEDTAATDEPVREQAAIRDNVPQARATSSPRLATKDTNGKNPAVVATEEYIKSHPDEFQLRDYHTPIPEAIQTPLGHKVIYLFSQDDIPITGMHITFDVNNENEVTRVQNSYSPVEKADTSPGLDVEEAIKNVTLPFAAKPKLDGNPAPAILYLRQGTNQPELSYVVPVTDPKKPTRPYDVIVRQSDGQVLGRTGGGRR